MSHPTISYVLNVTTLAFRRVNDLPFLLFDGLVMEQLLSLLETKRNALDVALETDRTPTWNHIKRESTVALFADKTSHHPLGRSLPVTSGVVRPDWHPLKRQIVVNRKLFKP